MQNNSNLGRFYSTTWILVRGSFAVAFFSLQSHLVCFAQSLPVTRVPAPRTQSPALAETENVFHDYTLLYVSPSKVAGQLTNVLQAAHPDAQVFADAKKNRIFVRGNQQVHSLTQQLLDKLDRPPSVPAGVPQATKPDVQAPRLKSHPYSAQHPVRIGELQKYFAGRTDTRIVYDERTSQLLVMAPSSIQAEISKILQQGKLPVAQNVRGQLQATRPQPILSATVPTRLPATTPRPLPQQNSGAILANTPVSKSAVQPHPVTVKNRQPLQAQSPPRAPQAYAPRSGEAVVQLKTLPIKTLQTQLGKLIGRPLSVEQKSGSVTSRFALEAVPGARVDVVANSQTGRLHLSGQPALVRSWSQVIQSMDAKPKQGVVTKLVSTKNVPKKQMEQVAATLASQPAGNRSAVRAAQRPLVSMMFQPGAKSNRANAPAAGTKETTKTAAQNVQDATGGLIGPVQIEFVEGLDVLVIRGDERDVKRVMKIINQIEQLTKVTEPKLEILPMQHVDSEAMATLVQQIYQQVLATRRGDVSITPLVKPNALLLIGRPENVKTVIDLVTKLDKPVEPNQEFHVFRLKYASSADAKVVIDEFFAERQGLGTKVLATADFRSNALVVRASPRDMAEVRALLARLDTAKSEAVDEVRVFQLRNSIATDLAPVLLDAIAAQGQSNQAGGGGQNAQQGQRAAMLRFMTIDAAGRRKLESGVLSGVRVNADARSNTLVVTAPAESMELIAALIQQLDRIPAAEAQLKVFTIANGDASALIEMLETLFGSTQQQQQGPALGGVGGGGDSLVQLRFSLDERTNSIIAAGTAADLAVVEAILLRLDESDIRQRQSVVYRLQNAPAEEVADALNNWLRSERELQGENSTVSAFEQMEREVIIVPETVSNSLIVSSTPRYFKEIERIVQDIDRRPPMVMIQVLIAEVSLNDTDEFGVEMGLQDSVLFDRSLIGNLVTTQSTTTTTTPGGAVTTVQQDTIQAATNTPGFDFANPNNGLGNSGSDQALSSAGKVAAQGISSFALGRVNSELGFGGFVFSASSESVSVLLRALQESRRLEVLSRPQIMAIDNNFAVVQVGQRVPRITGTQINNTGQVNTVQLEDVGLILRVQPRVSPDGLVVMRVEAEKSEVGPEQEGIPVSISATGQVVRSPRINITAASTTVHARSGQTVVLGGLISKRTSDIHRRVPLVSQIPLLGNLFRFDSVAETRTELLIIMTPRVVRNELDADLIKQVESTRMNWVLSDVVNLHGPSGLRSRTDQWHDNETDAIYPTYIPTEGEIVPMPADSQPNGQPVEQPTEAYPLPEGAIQPSIETGIPTTNMPEATPTNSAPVDLLPTQP